MDAADLLFPSESFDIVYSFAVFPHLDRPEDSVREVARVLRPGGLAYIDFILYTSRTGSHDVRLLGNRSAEVPLWAHLREQHQAAVRPSAYLNRLRLGDWRKIFELHMPSCDFILRAPERESLEPEARRLQAAGELTDYSLEELLTTKVAVMWQKPEVSASDVQAS